MFLIFVTLHISACMRHKPFSEEAKQNKYFGDDGDFDYQGTVGTPQDNVTTFKNIRGWQIPLYQTYQFKAKVVDANASRTSLRDFKFAILDEDGNPVCMDEGEGREPKCEYIATPSSEIVWVEKIPYDYFKAEATPVRIIRKIKGLGGRTGTRTIVLELNPWAKSRNLPNAFIDRTNEVTDEMARVIVSPGYRSADLFKAHGEKDSSELVVRGEPTRQVYEATDPILVTRSNKLETLSDDYQANDLVFSKYAPTEFVKRRNQAKQNSSIFEPVNELILGQNRIYVYREKNTNLPDIDGLKFDLTLKMKLGFKYSNQMSGYNIAEISAGRFRVHAHLVLEPSDGAQPVLLTPGLQPVEATVERDNDLQLDYKTIIPYYPSSGIIRMAVKIYPLGVDSLKPLDLLYTVGRFSELIGRGGMLEVARSRNNGFDFDEYVGAAINGSKAFELGNVDVSRDFQVGPLDIRFRTVEAGETAAQRTVIFRVQTDVFNEMASIREGDNVPFEIVSVHRDYNDPNNTSKWKFVRLTNGEKPNDPARVRAGKITWFDTITHKYYQKEELVERDIFITKWKPGLDLQKQIRDWVVSAKGEMPDDKTLPNGIQKLKIYLNPWDEKFGTFGMDARETPELFLKNVREREKIPTRFFIGDFGYETLRFRYKIDKDMNLNVKKTVLLNLTPRVLRYSSILEGINSVYNLRDGIYLMKTAIQKDYLDPAARNEADLYQIPLRVDGDFKNLPTQNDPGIDPSIAPPIKLGTDGERSQVEYGGRVVTNRFLPDGTPNPNAFSIPYEDPRRKRAMSMVKKLVRVNSGRVITPVEFSIEDLRLMRIRQQFFVQLEPVNQLRWQLVNHVTERFEQIFQLKVGKNSPILDKMTEAEQDGLKHLITRALDALATAVTDDVTISKLEDLESILQDPKVQSAFNDLARAQFNGQTLDLRLRDILLELKKEREFNMPTLHLNEEAVTRQQELAEEELEKDKKEHDDQVKTLEDLAKKNSEITERPTISEDQCGETTSVKVYEDTEAKQTISDSENLDPTTRSLLPFDTGIYGEKYLDTLSKFNPFQNADEQFFASIKTQDTLNKILTNDFTLAPAFSSVSNLDLLVDQKSGITPRTFVGPMTFLYNTNRGSLRPTDNLDEAYCETDDCNSLNSSIDSQYGEIQNYSYEKSPYHGSIAHFQNVTFNDQYVVDEKTGEKKLVKEGLETMFNRLEQQKVAYTYAEGLLTRFLDYFDMSYVSLRDRPIERLQCRDDVTPGSHCYVRDREKTVVLNTFIDEYSDTVNEIVNLDYKQTPIVDAKFQKLSTSLRARGQDARDHTKITNHSFPWGFVSPKYGKDMERCELGLPGLELVCNSNNEHKKLGGLMRSYDTEVAYSSPTKEELESIIRYPFKGHQMVPSKSAIFDQSTQSKMCDLLVYGEIGRRAKALVQTEEDKLELRRDLFEMARRCQQDIANELEPVVIERKFRIFETGRYYFLGGKSMNVQAGQGVRVGSGVRVSRNFGSRPLRIVTGIIEKGKSYIERTLGLLSGSFDFSYSIQTDNGYYEDTSILQGTYLVMQNAEFEVELTKYEQCLTVRWNPDFVEKYSRHVNFIDGKFSDFYVGALYLCSGVEENTPIAVNEKYYYFTQHFTEGDMLDPADIHNHPWLLALRGVREFRAFMLILKSWEKVGKDQYNPEFVSGEDMIDFFGFIKNDLDGIRQKMKGDTETFFSRHRVTTREEWPIHQMVTTYKRVLPTFNGTYTQLSDTDYKDRTWPWATGEPGDVMQESICTR